MSTATETKPVNRPCRPVQFVYRPHEPNPIEADSEAIAILAKARGIAAEEELSGALLILDSELLSSRGRMGDAVAIRKEMPRVRDILARRAVYVSRIGQIRRALKIKADAPVSAPEFGAFIHILASTYEGADLATQLGTLRGRIRSELDQADAAVEEISSAMGDDVRYAEVGARGRSWVTPKLERETEIVSGIQELLRSINPGTYFGSLPKIERFQYGPMGDELASKLGSLPGHGFVPDQWPQDILLERITAKLRDRKALAARLATIEDDNTQLTLVVADRVGKAVEAVGGVSKLQVDVVAAWALSGAMPESLVSIKARLDTAARKLRKLRSDLDELEAVTGPLSSASGAMKLDIERAESEYTAAHADWMRSSQAEAVALIESAMQGVETSRAALESLATSRPEAFPPGFYTAIAAARFDRAVASELDGVINTLAA